MIRKRIWQSKVTAALIATLAGGAVFSTCQTRLKDGIVDGSKEFLYSLFDPTAITGALFDLDDSTEDSSEEP